MESLYEIVALDNKGKEVKLEAFKGKVLLIVNTATGCGFTPQYKGLQELYEKYHDKGFEILDFPCNQFMNQAPGSDAEIQEFCTLRYHTTFPRFKKIEVNGDGTHPLYLFLKSKVPGKIKWNFSKFLVDREGNVIEKFGSLTKPEKLVKDIEKLL